MDLLKLLKKYDLKATPQRLCVLKILKKHEHPNIDELYTQVKSEYPSMSQTKRLATTFTKSRTFISFAASAGALWTLISSTKI